MKHYSTLWALALIACSLTAVSCEDSLTVDAGSDGIFETVDGTWGSVRSAAGAAQLAKLVIKNDVEATGHVFLDLSRTADRDVSVTFRVDPEALEAYNSAHGTSYEMWPAEMLSIENDGKVTVPRGSRRSGGVEIHIRPCGSVGTVYAVPVSATADDGVEMSSKASSYIYLVEDWGIIPNADDKGGVRNLVYVEVNDDSILNAGEYTVNGVPFFNTVSIFAANINLDSEGRPYVYCNENVAFVLSHVDEIIRPLQRKGIKVNLSILGNHDDAGMRSLNDKGAELFSSELKAYRDIYGLDGFDFDDEYSSYASGNYRGTAAGVVSSTSECTSENYLKLMKLCREKMPDTDIGIYWYTSSDFPLGDGLSETIDYAVFGAYGGWSTYYGDLPAAQQGPYAITLANSYYYVSETYLKRLVSDGYGYIAFYKLAGDRLYGSLFNQVSQILYGANVDFTGDFYGRNDLVANHSNMTYDGFLGNWSVSTYDAVYLSSGSSWWQWAGPQTFDVTIEPDVYGKSYKVYGWEGNSVSKELPIIFNYEGVGMLSCESPQTVGVVDGVTYVMSRGTYTYYPTKDWAVNSDHSLTAFSLEMDLSGDRITMNDTSNSFFDTYGFGLFTLEGDTYTSVDDISVPHSLAPYTFTRK